MTITHDHDLDHQHHSEADDELEPRLTPDKPRNVSEADRIRFEGYLAEIFTALGLDLDTPSTAATPRRHLKALFDTTSGYEGDPKLLTAFPTECRGGANCEIAQVVEGPIPFFALCEHHALPFFGNVFVGYVAHEGIIGISKLTRLVRVITRRFGVQERMTYQICDELDRLMAPHGVAVYVEAHHLCTQMRGVRELHPKTRTTSYRGVYVDSPQLRGEFFDVSGLRGNTP
ncbi:MAG: GTP cyclohydrolase I [Candidatus Limnocylindrales bacterium]